MTEPESFKVECGEHGKRDAAFVCGHLIQGQTNCGFHIGFDPDDPDQLYPDAWCDACDQILEDEGEWNDVAEAYADIKLVCCECYIKIREANWLEDQDQINALISDSFEYLQEKQRTFTEYFKIDKHPRWDWYQETGKLIFSNQDIPVVECTIQFVGTYADGNHTWMWAWANNSFTDSIKASSRTLRAMGEQQNYMKLASALWPAQAEDGWEMTAIMALHYNAIGAYRTPSSNGFVYMIVLDAQWKN